MEWSEQRDKLIPAYIEMQKQLEPVKKGSTNDFKGYRYADLADIWEACRKPLADHELCVMQTTRRLEDGGLELVTTLAHSSGQWVRTRLPILSTEHPQAMGSAMTYARKYSLATIVGLAADDDDDGQAASGGQRPQQRQQARRGQSRQQQAPATRGEQIGTEQAVTAWEQRIQRAKTAEDLTRLWRQFAEANPEGSQIRQRLASVWSARRDVLQREESDARRTHPQRAGD